MLDNKRYLYYVAKGADPKTAFQNMTEEIEMWVNYNNSVPEFQPKKYTIIASPENLLNEDQVQNYITTNDIKIRNNYAGCLFLTDDRFLFFMERKNV